MQFIASAIVDSPDLVEIEELDGGRRIELCVADDDLGRVIGRRGRTAQSMRTILRACGGSGAAVELDIVGREDGGAE